MTDLRRLIADQVPPASWSDPDKLRLLAELEDVRDDQTGTPASDREAQADLRRIADDLEALQGENQRLRRALEQIEADAGHGWIRWANVRRTARDSLAGGGR